MIKPRSRRCFLQGAGALCLGCLAAGGASAQPATGAAPRGVVAHGAPAPMAVADLFREARLEGEVVGFHASADMVGIISHAGDPLQCHWVSPARDATAHLDEFGLAAGGTLSFPIG